MEFEEILLLDEVYEIDAWEEPTVVINFPDILVDTVGYSSHTTMCDLLAMCDPLGAEL